MVYTHSAINFSYLLLFYLNIIYIYIYIHTGSYLMGRVFANGSGDWSSITDRVIPKTKKMVLDATLFNTWHYKERIKGKGVAPSSTPCVVAWCSIYYIYKNVALRFYVHSSYISCKFCQRSSVVHLNPSLSFIFYIQGSLVQGNLLRCLCCFFHSVVFGRLSHFLYSRLFS